MLLLVLHHSTPLSSISFWERTSLPLISTPFSLTYSPTSASLGSIQSPGTPFGLAVLSLFPDLVSDDKIKGWGRWRSDAYQRYCRMQLGQKRTIFAKIATALNKSLSPPDNSM